MDLETLRRELPSMTRARFGETVTVTPMVQGKMAMVADTTRAVLADVPCRFDLAPELEQVGGGRERPEAVQAISPHASVSFALADLMAKAAVADWPRDGDHVTRVHPLTGVSELYQITSSLEPQPAVILYVLSRIQ
jgi:hypothetical protein